MNYDVIIIGSGPAGLTAAIYASRDNLKTLVVGGAKWGGQLMLTTQVENYPGFPEGLLGPDLMERMKKQAERFGTEVRLEDVTRVDFGKHPFTVWGNQETQGYQGGAVIVAAGADTVWLGLPNEQRLIGRGVSSCAPCDAFFFKDKKVVVVGGGDTAMEEAQTLAKFASEVTIVHRRDSFRASKIMQDRALSLPNVKVYWNSAVIDVLGENHVTGVKLRRTVGEVGEVRELAIDGVFVAIGHSPNTKIFEGQLELDEKGYVKKFQGNQGDRGDQGKSGFQTMTSVAGVFVAGDVHDYHFRQAITAAGFGCMAAMETSRWLTEKS
ncbi:thioredoxin-disulfide reductase [Candidatus Gottesmanbacteria bacterium RIFCSPHIGHO2_01_FULL_47_48]|uniref:Thioredoxin reductase n=1 Tax=Candidatus Gottesmanbacteria bacterium RIFCSPHIGHO2_01_FULL_47_48 TaxID=1798381 RepID=A0A1F6A3F4_9BACT|nr:MAG: thioredoxin-disulfide reductase [Candidatus Gottesmanbacteria bacterium RIFCSPHIGHO2_01_FULL_47_48]